METKPNLGDEAINRRAGPGDRKGCSPVAVTQQRHTGTAGWDTLVVQSWLVLAGHLPVSGHGE